MNGQAVCGGHGTTLWDEGNWAFALAAHVFRGRNTIVLHCRPSKCYAEGVAGTVIEANYVEPIVLTGSYAANEQQSDGVYVVAPETGQIGLGAWEGQGYPAFSGTGEYTRRFSIPTVAGRHWIVLDDARHVAEVFVNGQSAGVRPWAPYEFDITDYVHVGENELTVNVTNGFGRLIRYSYAGRISHKVLSGLVGKVRLVTTG